MSPNQMSAIALASALCTFGVKVSSYAEALEWESADPKHKELVLKNYLLLAGHPVFYSDSTFVTEDGEKWH